MRKTPGNVWLLGMALLLPVAASAQTAAEISKKSRERGSLNLVGLTAELKLTTTNKDGKVKEQVLTSTAKKVGGKTHSLSRFSRPVGVAGVAVLTIEGAGDEARPSCSRQ